MNPRLEKLIEEARGRKMTPEEVKEQRVSFAYGNAPEESKSTMESMRAAAEYFDRVAEEEK